MILYPNRGRWSVDLFGTWERTVFSDHKDLLSFGLTDGFCITRRNLNNIPTGYFTQFAIKP
jgi:hypothetical protein